MNTLASPKPHSPTMKRSRVATTATLSTNISSPHFSSISLSLSTFAQQFHVSFVSISSISSISLSSPLNPTPPKSYSTTSPYIPKLFINPFSPSASVSSGHCHPYNLPSQGKHPPERSGIGLISPPKFTKLRRGRHSFISKAIIHVGVNVA